MSVLPATREQFDAYHRGEYVTLKRPSIVKHYVVVRSSGKVLEYSTIDGRPQPWTILRRSDDRIGYKDVGVVGYTSISGYDFHNDRDCTVIEVKA